MVVSTLLTAFRHHLGTSLADLEWTVSAYTLSFAVSSAGCAWPPDAAALIAARTVQGAGSATIMPVALALLNAAFSAPFAATGSYATPAAFSHGFVTAFGAAAGFALAGAAAGTILPGHGNRSEGRPLQRLRPTAHRRDDLAVPSLPE